MRNTLLSIECYKDTVNLRAVTKETDTKLGIQFFNLKGNEQFIFLCNPQKLSVNVCLMKILKSTATKKVTVCFY